jgi:hypothetical protein
MRLLSALLALIALAWDGFALGQRRYISETPVPGGFAIVQASAAAPLYVDSEDHPGVVRAVGDLQADIARVTGITPAITHEEKERVILVGTVGKSRLIDRLIHDAKIDAAPIAGKWESFLIQVVERPLPGVASALVIAGSDKRGTIYGVYDVSEQIGVSPWYWWADVPVGHKAALFVKPGKYVEGEPAVKYRGIFLNDEAPALTGWVKEHYGTYDHRFYTKVFELLLRLKANFLWPAMWDNAFNEDDPLNPKLADEYGIVMGTSHHEPMLRAQQEWKRHGKGPWDYSTNADELRAFWTEGIERNKNYESILTLAMRGDGDLPMSETANIALLERIVADQRKIIAEHQNPKLPPMPQVWALYKEVQEYYEKGMRVPDDVTLLWCDDNWGDIRRLPTPEERKRSGGAGIYYHFDYVGGPRSYKWLNTNPIPKVWEQMNLAHHYGANRIWIVNVGDLKPMEFPIEFFLDFARDPQRWPKEKLHEFTTLWAAREFGPTYAAEIADIVSLYAKYNGRRKPELLEPSTFSLQNYREAETVLEDYRRVVAQAERISQELPEKARDAFFELVLYPAKASEIVTELYITTGLNRLYASEGRAATNDLAAKARALFQADADLAAYYNHTLAGGKWNHMMDQTHIGYTYWNQPPVNKMPEVKEIQLPDAAEMGVAAEGGEFDVFNRHKQFIDVYNRGRTPFEFTATASAPWIELNATRGKVDKEERLWVSIDWARAPRGRTKGSILITGAGGAKTVTLSAFKPAVHIRDAFIEANGYVSIEAEHYSRRTAVNGVHWEKIPDYGRTDSAMTVFPVTAASANPPLAPCLEYRIYAFDKGKADVTAIIGPSLNFVPGRGLRFAVSFDDQPPQIVDALAHNTLKDWEKSVEDSVRHVTTTHTLAAPGYHTLKFWMVDPGVVLEKLVVDLGGLKPSYLGPPESARRGQARR